MFTGLVEEVGKVVSLARVPGGAHLRLTAAAVTEGLREGDSVAVDGVCLTAVQAGGGGFTAFLSQETLSRTTLGKRRAGDAVNLERALAFGGRLGGHLMAGHVEGVGTVEAIVPLGKGAEVRVRAPAGFERYLPPKGSVAVDGVSLTIASASGLLFTAAMVPETLARTTWRLKRPGEPVNLEPDLLLKYLKFLLEQGLAGVGEGGLSDRLRQAGFPSA